MDFLDARMIVIPLAALTATLVFLTVVFWLIQRRRERELHYRYELARQLGERGENAAALLRLLGADAASRWRARHRGLLLAGVVIVALGLGMLVGLPSLIGSEIARVGLVPLFLGIALILFTQWSGEREPQPPREEPEAE
jgi:Domain of unknown function (DUF6249)